MHPHKRCVTPRTCHQSILPRAPVSLAILLRGLPHMQLGGRLLDRLTNHFLDYNLSVQVRCRSADGGGTVRGCGCGG